MLTTDSAFFLLDSEWAAHPEEANWLARRKLSPHLSTEEQKTLQGELFIGFEEQLTDDLLTDVAAFTRIPSDLPGKMEGTMRPICAKFGMETFSQLVRWAVLTPEEEIRLFVES